VCGNYIYDINFLGKMQASTIWHYFDVDVIESIRETAIEIQSISKAEI
jgi:hypothetical protein